MTSTKNVFISHRNEDEQQVNELKDLLGSKSYEIRDSSIVSTKQNAAKDEEYIKREILSPRIMWASTLVVLISPDTCKSKWVDWEIEYAHKIGKRVVGVWIRGAKDADLPKNLDQLGDAVVGWHSGSIIDAIDGADNWVCSNGDPRERRDIP